MKIKSIIIAIAIICLAIIILWYPFMEDTIDKYYCKSGSDCVPEKCCHPDSCIHKNFGPNCEGVICSQECSPNTLDCGQGVCMCIDNKCQPIMNQELEE